MNINPAIWFEIFVQDMAKVRQFYETVFGFTLTKLEGQREMWTFPISKHAIGSSGALVSMPGMPSGKNSTVIYFYSEDCEVQEKRIVQAGGEIVARKKSIGQFGFMCLGKDPEGNMFGIHSTK